MTKKMKILIITISVFGAIFFLSFIMCLGIIVSSPNTNLEPNKTDNKKVSTNNKKASSVKTKLINEKKKEVKNTKTETNEVTKKPTIKPTVKPTIKPTINKDTMLNLQLNILKTDFKNVAEIKYKKEAKIIEIIPIEKSFMLEAMQAYNGDQVALNTWNELKNNLKGISSNVSKDIMISIVNNLNNENYLLVVNNGKVLYDFVKN